MRVGHSLTAVVVLSLLSLWSFLSCTTDDGSLVNERSERAERNQGGREGETRVAIGSEGV